MDECETRVGPAIAHFALTGALSIVLYHRRSSLPPIELPIVAAAHSLRKDPEIACES